MTEPLVLPHVVEKAPTHPPTPACWTEGVALAAYRHAMDAYPHEAAGIVVGGVYERLDNISTTPDRDIALSDADLLRVADAELFFHSHPDGIGCPSETDMRYQQQLGIPFAVIVVPEYDVFFFGEQLGRAPLIGRGFRHGVHDCFSLMRDWWFEKGVTMPDFPRDWSWWSKGKNLYLDGFESAGFERVPNGNAQPGDVLLFQWNYPVPMHGGLVVDRDLMLHHAAGHRAVDRTRLSGTIPRSRYDRHVAVTLRYAG